VNNPRLDEQSTAPTTILPCRLFVNWPRYPESYIQQVATGTRRTASIAPRAGSPG
jgi:hypothetical protein